MKQFLCLIFIALFSGSAVASSPKASLECVKLDDLNQTYQWTGSAATTVADTKLVFTVPSSGCTSDADFKLNLQIVGQTQHLQLVRVNPDYCKGVTRQIQITLKTQLLKVSDFFPVVMDNPILASSSMASPGNLVDVE